MVARATPGYTVPTPTADAQPAATTAEDADGQEAQPRAKEMGVLKARNKMLSSTVNMLKRDKYTKDLEAMRDDTSSYKPSLEEEMTWEAYQRALGNDGGHKSDDLTQRKFARVVVTATALSNAHGCGLSPSNDTQARVAAVIQWWNNTSIMEASRQVNNVPAHGWTHTPATNLPTWSMQL